MARRKELTRGEKNIAWIEQYCRIPEGKFVGQPVKLRPWQKDILCGIYDTPTRRAIISFGRKNAKTTLSAFLLLLHLCGPESRVNSQLYSAAQSREQAAILFALAAKVVRMSPDLTQHVVVRDTAKQLFCPELGTLYRALSAEASTAYGLSPVFVVHDELGQVKGPRSELYEALETASGAQESPLSVIISTQAPTDADLLSVLIDDAKRGNDLKTKLFLYTASEDLDPFSKEAMKAANPALGDFLNEEEVFAMAASAKRMPSSEASFRNLVLNQRINMANPLISKAVWEACVAEPEEDVFQDGQVYVGLDLSVRTDMTALAYAACDYQGVWHCRVQFFSPKEGVHDRAHRDRVPYDVWAKDGYLTLTPGHTVDYAYVVSHLSDLADRYNIALVAFDRYRIDVLQKEMADAGLELPMMPFGQGFKDMTPAVENIESLLLQKKIRHGGNPILRWNAANAVAVSDPAGSRKLDKSKSTGRIDGLVALTMALGVAEKTVIAGPSIYETRGILELDYV